MTKDEAKTLVNDYFDALNIYIQASNAEHDDVATKALDTLEEIESKFPPAFARKLQASAIKLMRSAP